MFPRQLFPTLIIALAIATATPLAAAPPNFTEHVQPIFRAKCAACHNPDKKSGGLDLSNFTSLMQGGSSGESIEPGDSSSSYLYMLVTHESEPAMPLESPRLPDEELETIAAWIDGGVLESSGSKAIVKKQSAGVAMAGPSLERPESPAMPPRLSLEPIVRTTHSTAVTAIATSPWSPLAAVAAPKQVLLYDTGTLALVGTLPFPEGMPQVLRFSRNGDLLLAGGGKHAAAGKAIVWNVRTGERVFEIGDELDTVLAADISSDHMLVALAGPQRVVRVYSTETGMLKYECRKHTDWIYALAFSPDAVLLATGDRSGGLLVWEAWTGREYLTLKGHTAGVTDVTWRSDSNVLATGSEDGTIRLWEMENGGQIKQWSSHGGVASVEFSRDARLLSCGRDRVTRLWDQNGSQLREFEAFGDLALQVAFCNETARVLAGDWTGEIRVFNAADGARLGGISANPPTLAERLAAAEKTLAECQATHQPLHEAFQQAKNADRQARQELMAAQTELSAAESRLAATHAEVAAMTEQVATLEQSISAAEAATALLTDAVPPLQMAAQQARAAADQLPDDTQLTELAGHLKELANARAAELATAQATLAKQTPPLTTARQELADAQAALEKAGPSRENAMQEVARLMQQVVHRTERLAAATPSAEAAAAEVAVASAEVERWTAEIAHSKLLAEYHAARVVARESLHAAELVHAEKLAATEQVEQQFAAARASADTAADHRPRGPPEGHRGDGRHLDTATQERAAAIEAKTRAEQAVVHESEILASIESARDELQQAVNSAGVDQPLVDLFNGVQALVTTKTIALKQAQADLATRPEAIAAMTTRIAAAEENLAAMQSAHVAADTASRQAASLIEPVARQLAAARQSSDEAAQAVATAKARLAAVEQRIAVAKGLAE